MEFDLHCKWVNDGVDLYINSGKGSEKVGRIPRGIRQATISAIAPIYGDGEYVNLFRYVLTPNFDEKSMAVQLFNGAMEVEKCEIVIDASKNIELVKEK
jgi:hypothetical protein